LASHVTTSPDAAHEKRSVSTEFLTGQHWERYHRASKAVRVLPPGFFDDALLDKKMKCPNQRARGGGFPKIARHEPKT
jgi:hypothetical protein